MSILPSATSAVPFSAARRLPLPARQQLALGALAGQSVTALADQHQVSRKFVYRQLGHEPRRPRPSLCSTSGPTAASPLPAARDQTLAAATGPRPHADLPQLPPRRPGTARRPLRLSRWGRSTTSSTRPSPTQRPHNAQQDLAAVRIGAHDEIFQGGRPVLVGADVVSTYCYLLSPEEHRDADAWGVRLLELRDRGFRPVAAVAETRHVPSLGRLGRPERWQREQALWRRGDHAGASCGEAGGGVTGSGGACQQRHRESE